jgi:hypothetical protein
MGERGYYAYYCSGSQISHCHSVSSVPIGSFSKDYKYEYEPDLIACEEAVVSSRFHSNVAFIQSGTQAL